MTVPMAIVDYIPVALFGAAAVLLLRDLYNKMSKGAFARDDDLRGGLFQGHVEAALRAERVRL